MPIEVRPLIWHCCFLSSRSFPGWWILSSGLQFCGIYRRILNCKMACGSRASRVELVSLVLPLELRPRVSKTFFLVGETHLKLPCTYMVLFRVWLRATKPGRSSPHIQIERWKLDWPRSQNSVGRVAGFERARVSLRSAPLNSVMIDSD